MNKVVNKIKQLLRVIEHVQTIYSLSVKITRQKCFELWFRMIQNYSDFFWLSFLAGSRIFKTMDNEIRQQYHMFTQKWRFNLSEFLILHFNAWWTLWKEQGSQCSDFTSGSRGYFKSCTAVCHLIQLDFTIKYRL